MSLGKSPAKRRLAFRRPKMAVFQATPWLSFFPVAIKIDCGPMLKALADQTRWRIVRELLDEALTVSELTDRLQVTQYNVSKHLRVLREAGILEMEKIGKNVSCRIAAGFRKRLSGKRRELDLGCCSFSFE